MAYSISCFPFSASVVGACARRQRANETRGGASSHLVEVLPLCDDRCCSGSVLVAFSRSPPRSTTFLTPLSGLPAAREPAWPPGPPRRREQGWASKSMLRDDFRQNPQDMVVVAGDSATLECQPPRGHPEPTTFWRKDKARLDLKDDRITIRGGKLTISDTRKSDGGMYVCVATNMVGERESEMAQLSVFERPIFVRRPVNQVVLMDESAEFRCQVQGDPAPSLRWRKDEAEIPRGRYDTKYEKDEFILRVKKVSSADQGSFACVAENRVGKVEASATLTVREAPQFVVRPRDQIVTQGRGATFPCETRGNPQPAVFWQKEGSQVSALPATSRYIPLLRGRRDRDPRGCECVEKPLLGPPRQRGQRPDDEHSLRPVITGPPRRKTPELLFPSQPPQVGSRFSVASNGDLTIASVQRADAGYYVCQALSVAGSILAKAQLEVSDALKDRPPPIIQQGPTNQTVGVGGLALLGCRASGDPEPTVTWLKGGLSLMGTEPHMSLLDPGSLQIQNTKLSDSGLYTCLASSSSGETSWSAFLDVRESAEPVDSASHNATALPGPPSKPEVTDVTKSSVSLSWRPRPEDASLVSSYVIEAFGHSVRQQSELMLVVSGTAARGTFPLPEQRPHCVPSASPLCPLCVLTVSPLCPLCVPSVSPLRLHCVPFVFPLRPHCVPSVSPLRPLCVFTVSPLCPLCVLTVSPLRPLCVSSAPPLCPIYIPSASPLRPLCTPSLSHLHSLCVPSVSPLRPLCVPSVSSLCVRSQLVSNSWQTVADHVKSTAYTVEELRPNTVYLFIIRAVNARGVGDPSVMSEPVRTQVRARASVCVPSTCLADISPAVRGVDHRQVQKELGDVIVSMHNPVVLSSTSVRVENPSRFIQGYRVLYRQTSGLSSPGAWQEQDLKAPTERGITLRDLKKGVVYEIKVRPFFNEFQGADSESMTARTLEEGNCPLEVRRRTLCSERTCNRAGLNM
ncbi:hypothetical protein P4O66_000254 [Electrophorus voltai]|uniref:Roundabout, axon guidance receptor, homolog 2 (Drosophila) n=1 Tax=Electrophorus voltai TaxID=2609070 RepID=A0AAD9DZY7_9TELE|nr:hypothetical protein P4O66_000254 [Electrophorus voltai]